MPDSTGPAVAAGPFFAVLARALAEGADGSQLMPSLHREVVDRMGALCSMLVESDPETGERVGTSAYGAFPGGLRLTATDAEVLDSLLAVASPAHVRDLRTTCPPLARGLGAPAAVVAPVPQQETSALLAVGLAGAAQPGLQAVAEAASVFAVALEWARLRRAGELQRRLREVALVFSRGATSSRNLAAGLEALCMATSAAFGARRVSIWMHDRRARSLALQGSSDPAFLRAGSTVAADDTGAAAARGLRLDRPAFAADPDSAEAVPARSCLLAPLRGRRRALGTLVIEGLSGPPSERAILLEAARDFGRQLSSVIENVQLLAEVLRSHRELEDVFDSFADLVVVCDRSGKVVSANLAFCDRIGRAPDEIRDVALTTVVGAELSAWVMGQTAANTPRSPAVPARQFEDPALKGTFHVTVTSLINNEGAHVGAVMVARDVTEQARLEAERALLHQRLAQSEKLAALGQFVAGIAHELNNPLQGVLGHLELMKATGELSRSQRRGLQTAYREADRAAKIVSNLLVFAGSGKRVRRRCSLNRILRRALALRAGRLRRARIRVVRRLDERQPRLLGDPLLLQQAFLNIILNAEQAMSGGSGRLEVSSAVTDRGRWAAVRVRDTGPGLSVIARDRLFEPFFTTKDVGDGTGLGLAIAYGIIQDHGGEILADNHPQGGARFTVRLPTDRLVIK